MKGTTWLDRIVHHHHALKAVPRPAQLIPSAPPRYANPISWEGWPDRGGTGAGLSSGQADNARDEQRARTAITSAWVYSCCQAIANELSAASLMVKRRAGDEGLEDVDNHPFERLWEQPNPFMGRAAVMAFWTWSLLLQGEAYLFLRPEGGVLKEIWPIPPWRMQPVEHPTEFVAGYAFTGPDNRPVFIDRKYIVYSKLTNPFDPRRGLSPLVATFDAVESDLAMRRWNKTFFSKENAAPTGIIAVPRDTLDGDLERIRMEIRDFFGGGTQRVGVARAGELDWKPFDRSQKDMEFLQGREFSRGEIERAFGVPEGYFSKDATRANSEGAKATLIEAAVWPRLVLLMEDMNAQAAPHWLADDDLRIEFEDIRPRNVQQELAQFQAYAPVLTVNELRRLAGYDNLPDVRGRMLLEELKKGAGQPGAATAAEIEEVLADMEDEAAQGGAQPAEQVAAPQAETPMDEGAALAEQPEEEAKALDLERWQRKAIKALRAGRGAAVRFSSGHIDPEEARRIAVGLSVAETADEVRAVFGGATKAAEPEDAEIDAAYSEALAWARLALGGGQ